MTVRYYEVPETFSEWRQFARYSLRECETTFKVTRRTVNNWESGRRKPPQAVLICFGLFAGRLDHLGKRWRGFRITSECIESPDGDFVRCEEIRAFRYAMQSAEINRLRRCRMNEDENGQINTPDVFPANVTLIDKAPKKPPKNKTDHQLAPSKNHLFKAS